MPRRPPRPAPKPKDEKRELYAFMQGLRANEIGRFESCLRMLNGITPVRTTARQLQGFVLIAFAESMGQSMTLSDLKEQSGDGPDGTPILGQHMNRSYQLYLDPKVSGDTDSLNWVYQDIDPDDARRKYLRLTPEGVEVAVRLTNIMKGEEE
jgi:hypothetical protein